MLTTTWCFIFRFTIRFITTIRTAFVFVDVVDDIAAESLDGCFYTVIVRSYAN